MKLAIADLETSGFYADSSILLCCSIKDYHTHKVTTLRADKYKNWKTKKTIEKPFIEDVLNALDDYDILVFHNGEFFDKGYMNAKAVQYGLYPVLRAKKTIDPVLVSRRHLRLGRNSLAALIDYLRVPVKKTPIELSVWTQAALEGDTECMDKIVKHCEHDVITLHSVYDKLRDLIDKIDKRGSSF